MERGGLGSDPARRDWHGVPRVGVSRACEGHGRINSPIQIPYSSTSPPLPSGRETARRSRGRGGWWQDNSCLFFLLPSLLAPPQWRRRRSSSSPTNRDPFRARPARLEKSSPADRPRRIRAAPEARRIPPRRGDRARRRRRHFPPPGWPQSLGRLPPFVRRRVPERARR